MYTCEQCGADFDERVKSCLICGGDVHANGTQSHYVQPEPEPEYHSARYQQPQQYYETQPEQRRELPPAPPQYLPPPQEQRRPYNEYLPPRDFYHEAAGGRESLPEKLGRLFGLHPAIAVLAIMTGGVLSGAELVGLPLLPFGAGEIIEGFCLPAGLICGGVLALVTYLGQEEWSHDSKKSALIKAMIVGFLTALPGGVLGYKKLGKIMGEMKG